MAVMEPLTEQQIKTLMAPLNSQRVAHRQQGGRQLSYLEAWDVKASLIRVFGFGGFSAEVTDAKVLRFDEVPSKNGGTNNRVTAMATVRLTIHQTGAIYEESAAASQTGPDVGEVTDFALKTAESDALKRAATYLGTQFGLSLYNNGTTTDVVRVNLAPDQKMDPQPDANPNASEQLARATGQQQPNDNLSRAAAAAQQANEQSQTGATVSVGVPENVQQFADSLGAEVIETEEPPEGQS